MPHLWNIFFFKPFHCSGPSSSCLRTVSLMVMPNFASSATVSRRGSNMLSAVRSDGHCQNWSGRGSAKQAVEAACQSFLPDPLACVSAWTSLSEGCSQGGRAMQPSQT